MNKAGGRVTRSMKNQMQMKLNKSKKVSSGPQVWVSCLLHQKGALSTNRIWEEFTRDSKVEKDLIPTKSYLKNQVIQKMIINKKITPAKARDMPQYKAAGWQLNSHKAFCNVDPAIIIHLDPMPRQDRKDVQDYINAQYNLLKVKEIEQEKQRQLELAKKKETNH